MPEQTSFLDQRALQRISQRFEGCLVFALDYHDQTLAGLADFAQVMPFLNVIPVGATAFLNLFDWLDDESVGVLQIQKVEETILVLRIDQRGTAEQILPEVYTLLHNALATYFTIQEGTK